STGAGRGLPPREGVVGEVGGREKDEFLGNAYALLFPIDWPEPFGLVMIEALACGTPVIAWRCGSVPEVIADGVTGFVVDSIEQGVTTAWRDADGFRGEVWTCVRGIPGVLLQAARRRRARRH